MGYYINPKGDTKETWLETHGVPVSISEARMHAAGQDEQYIVCLVDNGWMTAAGIAYDDRERDAFTCDDGRPKKWYRVKRDALKPHCAVLA